MNLPKIYNYVYLFYAICVSTYRESELFIDNCV